MGDYPAFAPIPRLHRDITITEKIDGTNGLISLQRLEGEGAPLVIRAGSRNRWITPEDDNFGFAKWVADNAGFLAVTLGEGLHHGEWWGSGIQRGYGLEKGEKRFSLFNTFRWKDADFSAVPGLGVVPVLSVTTADHLNDAVLDCLGHLALEGSTASPGFMKPEGVVVYHHAAKQYFKATIERDEEPKSLRNGKAGLRKRGHPQGDKHFTAGCYPCKLQRKSEREEAIR